jgi:uncharacterized OB-fold protein
MTTPQASQPAAPPPQPLPDAASRPYWEHTARGELAFPRCQTCGTWHSTPIEFCRKCGGASAYETVSGEATVYTFLVQHHKVAPGFDDLRPYVVALVSPKEAPELRVVTRLVDVAPGEVKIGMPVKVRFVDHPGGDFKLPVFAPA